MVFELVGSRVFAPYLGTSLYIWTSIIGVILGSLSLGYWWGGRLADRQATARSLALIMALAGALMLLVAAIKFPVLVLFGSSALDLRLAALLAAGIIFAPVSIVLGMVSPYAVRLKIESVAASGRLVGRLYALSTVGSITGTFAAGYFLIAYLGTTKILLLLALLLFVASFLVFSAQYRGSRIGLAAVAAIFLVVPNIFQGTLATSGIRVDVDTHYNRFLLIESVDAATNRPTLNMVSSREATQAGMFLDDDNDLVYPYSKYYRLADFFNPEIKSALMIGGGAYSYPKDFLAKHPDAMLDVVEIDPGVTELAREYFNLQPDSRLSIYHEDGRVFLNRLGEKKYDAIYGDAFHSYFDVPFQLTTIEAVQKIADHLTDDGVYIVNINASLGGPGASFLKRKVATLQAVFPQVYQLPVDTATDQEQLQNIMLVALKSHQAPDWTAATGEAASFLAGVEKNPLASTSPVLTDDYAPIENFISSLVKK